MRDAYYSDDVYCGDFDVVYTTDRGDKMIHRCSSPYIARKFVNKLKHGEKYRGYIFNFVPSLY